MPVDPEWAGKYVVGLLAVTVLGMLRFICAIALLLSVSCSPGVQPADPSPPEAEIQQSRPGQEARSGPDARLVPKIYWISADIGPRIPHRLLDAVNAIRSRRGLEPVGLSENLIAAAKTHARDMSVQNRPWHFGSDGSSPINRAANAGYEGRVLGENIAESFESDLETLSAWMQNPAARNLLLSSSASSIGIGWHQGTQRQDLVVNGDWHLSPSVIDCDRRSCLNSVIDIIHFPIGDRNATFGPVPDWPAAKIVRLAVNENVGSRVDSPALRGSPIFRIRIRYAERQMKTALGVTPVYDI